MRSCRRSRQSATRARQQQLRQLRTAPAASKKAPAKPAESGCFREGSAESRETRRKSRNPGEGSRAEAREEGNGLEEKAAPAQPKHVKPRSAVKPQQTKKAAPRLKAQDFNEPKRSNGKLIAIVAAVLVVLAGAVYVGQR